MDGVPGPVAIEDVMVMRTRKVIPVTARPVASIIGPRLRIIMATWQSLH